MPIRFRCVACRQLLSIGRRKAGAEIQCPKCGQAQRVPTQQEAAAALAAESGRPSASLTPPPPGIFIFDEDLDEESGAPTSSLCTQSLFAGWSDRCQAGQVPAEAHASGGVGADVRGRAGREVIWISRRTVYLQALLIFLVGLGGFALGYWLGWADSPTGARPQSSEEASGPILVEGRLFYRPEPLRVAPDEGAVVIFLPANRHPPSRFITIGLRPQDPPAGPNHATVQAIVEFGGAYARTDAEGNFLVQLPSPGEYYILFVSRHARRAQSSIPENILQEMKRYFPEPRNLLEQAKFHWIRQNISFLRGPIEHDFDR